MKKGALIFFLVIAIDSSQHAYTMDQTTETHEPPSKELMYPHSATTQEKKILQFYLKEITSLNRQIATIFKKNSHRAITHKNSEIHLLFRRNVIFLSVTIDDFLALANNITLFQNDMDKLLNISQHNERIKKLCANNDDGTLSNRIIEKDLVDIQNIINTLLEKQTKTICDSIKEKSASLIASATYNLQNLCTVIESLPFIVRYWNSNDSWQR